MRPFTHWRWRLNEVYVRFNGETRYIRRAVGHEGEVLESLVTNSRVAALRFISTAMKRLGRPEPTVTDGPRTSGEALKRPPTDRRSAATGLRVAASHSADSSAP
jgi:putative transposase